MVITLLLVKNYVHSFNLGFICSWSIIAEESLWAKENNKLVDKLLLAKIYLFQAMIIQWDWNTPTKTSYMYNLNLLQNLSRTYVPIINYFDLASFVHGATITSENCF